MNLILNNNKGEIQDVAERNKELSDAKTAMINLLEDVEKERDSAAREKNRVRAILYSIGDGVFVIDKDLTILMFNEAASVISGFAEDEVIGKRYDSVLKFFYEKTGEVNDEFVKNVFKTGERSKMSNHTALVRKDGRKVSVDDSVAPIKDEHGNISGCVVVFHDVTKERAIDKMKTDFISIASHQLRTPLTGIQWVVERFLKKEKLSETGKDYLNDVHVSVRRLNELVDLLLNVTRIEEGRVSVSPREFDLVDFLEDYLKECVPLTTKKNIKMIFAEHPKELKIFTDSGVLRNIVQSVVSNAIEYTMQNGEIEVALKASAEAPKPPARIATQSVAGGPEGGLKEKAFLLSVKDNGIGIPQAEQKEIFTKFKRGSNAKLIKTDGTGLGLYLARQATDLLGGKIWLESVENKGTTFFVELPIEIKVEEKEEKVDK